MDHKTQENQAGGCAVDCSLKAFSPNCASDSNGCSSKPPVLAWVGLTIVIFATAVWLLGNFGKPILDSMGRGEKTIAYLDMARQSLLTRDYAAAENFYRQAITDAQMQGGGDNLAYAMATYAEFLRKRKRVAEAIPYEKKAKEIQGIAKNAALSATPAATSTK